MKKMLNIDNSQLVAIDIQGKLVNAAYNGNLCVNKASILINAAKILNIPAILTEQYPKGLGKTVDVIDTTCAKTIEKETFSAFLKPEFKNAIISNNRKQIVIFGIETHICVLQTACDMLMNGYEVFIVKDASSSRNPDEHNAGLEFLKQYGGKIVTTEIVLFQWLKTSKHEKFKEIQALIK